MEVVIAIILLFGAFSLGSATHDGANDDSASLEIPVAVNEGQDVPSKAPDAESVDHAQFQDCLANRHDVIYRDLTRAHAREIESETTHSDDCDETCPDE